MNSEIAIKIPSQIIELKAYLSVTGTQIIIIVYSVYKNSHAFRVFKYIPRKRDIFFTQFVS